MRMEIYELTRSMMKRARRGLYHGKRILSGDKISDSGGNRTRRKWKPNVQKCSLYSEILERRIDVKATTAALRNIDKAGGLDQYILKTSDRKLDSDLADALKAEMKERLSLRRKGAEPIGVPLAAQSLATRNDES